MTSVVKGVEKLEAPRTLGGNGAAPWQEVPQPLKTVPVELYDGAIPLRGYVLRKTESGASGLGERRVRDVYSSTTHKARARKQPACPAGG